MERKQYLIILGVVCVLLLLGCSGFALSSSQSGGFSARKPPSS